MSEESELIGCGYLGRATPRRAGGAATGTRLGALSSTTAASVNTRCTEMSTELGTRH